MHRSLPRSLVAALVIALSGCGADLEVIAGELAYTSGQASLAPSSLACAGGLCLSEEDAARILATKASLESCVPSEEVAFVNDPAGVALSHIGLETDDDGQLFVHVGLATTSPQGFFWYPGTGLVAEAGLEVAVEHLYGEGFDPASFGGAASSTLYGLEPCSETMYRYPVRWLADDSLEGKLTAQATTDVGDTVVDAVTFVLRPLPPL